MTLKNILLLICLVGTLVSCGEKKDTHKSFYSESKNGNRIQVHSNSVDSLSKLINLTILNPDSVEYKFTYFNNSSNRRITGPSDFYLNAIVYYSGDNYEKLIKARIATSIKKPSMRVNDFKWDWLKDDLVKCINKIPETEDCPSAIFFFKPPLIKGSYLLIDSVVLINIRN